jgi:hypothetical protein
MMKATTGASPDECYIFAEAMLISRNKEELKTILIDLICMNFLTVLIDMVEDVITNNYG